MARKRYTPEQLVSVLRQVEVLVANGRQTKHAFREPGIAERMTNCGVGSMGSLKENMTGKVCVR